MNPDHRKMRLLLKDCAAGFYQQMYFLGKDVSHPKGNQLQAYGFTKSPSTGLKGTSCYTYQKDSDTIELYGACAALYSNDAQMVFLRERCRFYQWLPEHKLVAGSWSQADISSENPHETLRTLTPLLQWWVDYEKWIEQRLGRKYREQCYHEWKKLKHRGSWLAPVSARAWVAQLLQHGEHHVRPKRFALV